MTTATLPAQEKRTLFEEQGYLVLEGMLDEEEVDACAREIERLHTLAAELSDEERRRRSFQLEPYAAPGSGEGRPVLRKIEKTRQHSAVFRDLAAHPRLLETIRLLLGDDLLLFRSTLMLKPAHHGSAHGLHQDSAYWPMEPPSLVTVSIALTDSDPDNGCIQVIPGSHKWGMQRTWGRITRDRGQPLTDRADVDLSQCRQVPLKAGSALLFHSLIVHGSGPNNSPRPRHTALYAYFPPAVRYRPDEGRPRQMTYPVVHGLDGRAELTLSAD